MAKLWMKLDYDFWRSPEFRALIRAKNEAWAFKVLKVYCLASEKYGRLDMADPLVRSWVEDEMGMTRKRLDEFFDVCVECEIFDRRRWEEESVVTCKRLSEDGMKRLDTESKRSYAGRASGEARRKRKDEQTVNTCSADA